MNTYEGLFIFPDAMADVALTDAIKRIQGEVEKLGGTIMAAEILGRRTFARRMQKQEAGHYVQMMFQLDPAQVVTLRGRYRLSDDIFRVQIVRVSPQEVAIWKARHAKDTKPQGEGA